MGPSEFTGQGRATSGERALYEALGYNVRMLLRKTFRFEERFRLRRDVAKLRKAPSSESPEMKRLLAEFDKFEHENPELVREAESGQLMRQMIEEIERWHKAAEEAQTSRQ